MNRIVEKLCMASVWISRIHRCRGFGIQSPWAYRLVCEVINGRCDDGKKHSLGPLAVKTDGLCRRLSDSIKQQTGTENGNNGAKIIRIKAAGDYRATFSKAVTDAVEGTVIVIEGIKRNAETRRFWRETAMPTPGTVTFDLFYCGLLCFKSKLYKRNYIVNF